MQRLAVIVKETGVVDNIVVWDGESPYDLGADFETVPVGDALVDMGFVYQGGVFRAPEAA
jgi:hypothetical protein